ncbi:Pyroglutamyl-peptidase 1 [Trichinella britovi]|uniref:Pyroglutamyl-peptidase 1 n=1 Tax=Trichinella britovi TaxID=45882 RepID=A0A0V1CVA9_TRIBR|nr:Pyroglutamyl-peptidase 1 [Trichinella sp. T9]KRY53236.1 Pyroglutamyl-peptidase 1 [Trichinella britovi]
MPKSVIVTGFGSFSCYDENPSWQSVLRLSEFKLENVDLQIHCIPVIYKEADKFVDRVWEIADPDLMMHVGVSGLLKESIAIEEQAHNFGYCEKDILANYSSVLKTECPVESIVNSLNACYFDSNLKFHVSRDPGRYLCGYTYFKSLIHNTQKTIFVHVPPFSSFVSDETVANALRSIILSSAFY